jgi:AcrR family transcriptional regulator
VDSARVRWVADAAERRRHRRGEVLEAARTQFALRGFEATTIRDLADAAGITAGNLYRYFESKDSMIHEIPGDFSDRLLAIGAASHYQEGAVVRFGLLVNVIDRGVAASELNLVAGSDLVAADST